MIEIDISDMLGSVVFWLFVWSMFSWNIAHIGCGIVLEYHSIWPRAGKPISWWWLVLPLLIAASGWLTFIVALMKIFIVKI